MDVVQWGRMLWVWVQHHDKMVIIADVSSAALIKRGSKVLQNVRTLYHFNTVLYPNTSHVTQTATASVLLWNGCQQMGTTVCNPHKITYYSQSGPVLLSCTDDWCEPVCFLPWPASCLCLVLLIHFAPYPPLDSAAFNDELLVNNEL
jgi:hypothetical protein